MIIGTPNWSVIVAGSDVAVNVGLDFGVLVWVGGSVMVAVFVGGSLVSDGSAVIVPCSTGPPGAVVTAALSIRSDSSAEVQPLTSRVIRANPLSAMAYRRTTE